MAQNKAGAFKPPASMKADSLAFSLDNLSKTGGFDPRYVTSTLNPYAAAAASTRKSVLGV